MTVAWLLTVLGVGDKWFLAKLKNLYLLQPLLPRDGHAQEALELARLGNTDLIFLSGGCSGEIPGEMN